MTRSFSKVEVYFHEILIVWYDDIITNMISHLASYPTVRDMLQYCVAKSVAHLV